ncbi:MAG: universal stress protein [Actinobacteria bacterium]|nr:universal stress protein [Actinomycetota bacterium]MBI3686291.1 universal stress protein [Actinomycetota bacterium]
MRVVVWLTEPGWPAAVDAARTVPGSAEIVLLQVAPPEPDTRTEPATTVAPPPLAPPPFALTSSATARLGRHATVDHRRGETATEVVRAAHGADLLIVVRDGTGPGPTSLGPTGRFILDHAPCPVLLVWPPPEAISHPWRPTGRPKTRPGEPHPPGQPR